MGCVDSKALPAPAQPIEAVQPGEDADKTVKMLQKGLADVKANLVEQHRNKSMVAEIIKMLFTFVQSTLTTGQGQKVPEFIGLAFIGLHVRDGVFIEGVKYGWKIGSALHALTEPNELSRRNVADNFLSCAHKFKDVMAMRSTARGHGNFMDDEPEAREAFGEADDYEEAAAAGGGGAGASYKELQATMLSVLDPLCDMVDGLLNPYVAGRFLKATKKRGEDLEAMKNQLGIATTIVKVFEPVREADTGRGLQLLAVMGPESYGKSTLINHILYNGQNKDFMPATPGMGTQVICKIAAGPLETLQRSSDEFPQTGDVKHMVEKVNADMRKKRDEKTKKGQTLGIKEMEMLRATVKFEPPYPVQFLDVPGTKKETIFHTRVALGLATTLVLVSGTVDKLVTQLESGDLCMLKDAVKGLGRPIPIQCLASYRITESEFNASKHHMKRTLQESFPTCKDMIQEPLYMNFFEARDHAHRQSMVEKFYAAMATAEAQVMDPLERFGQIENDVRKFTKDLSGFFREEMKEYLTAKVRGPGAALQKVESGISAVLTEVQNPRSGLEGAFSAEKISHALQRVKLGRMGTFKHHSQAQVRDVANYVQWLLNQCRIHHMSWLKESSEEFHNKSFGKAFAPLRALAQNSHEKTFIGRLCDTFKYCNQTFTVKDMSSLAWWTQEYTSHIAPYLDGTALGCLLMGFHLVSTDTRNKVDLVGLLDQSKKAELDKLNDIENGVTDKLIDDLGKVNYADWVDRVNERLPDREAAFEELYQTITEAGGKFEEIALATGFLDRIRDNTAMGALVELAFVLMESAFIDLQEDTGGYKYTQFSQHLQIHAATADLQTFKPIIQGHDRQAAYVACCEALRTMQQNQSVSATWHAKFRNRTLEKDIQKIQEMRDMLGDKFEAGHERAMVLVPQDARKGIMARSVMQGLSYPIASAALAVLDQKIKFKADAKPGREFPAYALGEIQRAGARVAIFMRRGDTASYDPLSEENALLEKLQGEPNLVVLYVLWTPPSPGAEWNTPDYRQRWKMAISAESFLDVKLVPMDGSFDCQQFVDGEVAAAVKGAGAKAAKSLGQIREAEKRMLLNFASEVEKYENDFASAKNNNPKKFHGRMVKEHHKELDRLMAAIRPMQENFHIPDAEFNGENFKSDTLDQLAKFAPKADPGSSDASTDPGSPGAAGDEVEKKEGITFNELECRSFNFHVLLGQCVQKSSRLAGTVYEKAVTKILNDIGDKEFFMGGEQILKELDIFCAKYKQDPDCEAEIHRLNLLKLLMTKQSFQHMYVGCVSYKLMPPLYATVLPMLLKGGMGAEVPTDVWYKSHMKTATTMLEDGNKRSQRRRAST